MNTLAIALLWCVVQVTLLTLLAIGFYYALRRLGPQAGGAVALSTVALIVGLSLLAFSPWPRWSSLAAQNAGLVGTTPNDEPVSRSNSPATPGDALQPLEPVPLAAESAGPTFWDALVDEFSRVSTATDAPSRLAWPNVLAVLVMVGVVLGTLRLAVGLMAVGRYRSQSKLIDAPQLTELLDVLLAEIGCRRRPEMRESDAFFSAATVGWRRPVILLPAAWRKWNEHELRAVLAHEIAHIQGGDALACLLAQVALALHFYHPLVHWLVARLRLEQELAADGVAAELSGGRQSYLKTLAAMALDQEDKNVVWPARAFVPARTAFLRRIVVLRNFHRPIRATSGRSRAAAIACVMLAGLAVAGLRPPAEGLAAAQEPARAETETIDWSYVPEDAVFVFTLRPAAILERARQIGFGDLDLLGFKSGPLDLPFEGLKPDQVEQLSSWMPAQPVGPSEILQTTEPVRLVDVVPVDVELRRSQGKTYFVTKRFAVVQLNDRTIGVCTVSDKSALQRLLSLEAGNGPEFLTDEVRQQTAGDCALFAFDWAEIRPLVPDPDKRFLSSDEALFFNTPAMEEVKQVVLGLRADDQLRARLSVVCRSKEGAALVEETLNAYKVIGRDMLLGQLSRMPNMEAVQEVYQAFFRSIKTERVNSTVQATGAVVIKKDWPQRFAAPIKAAEQAAQRTGSANKLKRLGLAMHIYYDAHKRLPTPVFLGAGGKTPYSWRVAILPMIGEQSLYNRYRFDEPWDGPNNRKLLAEMPDEYRHPAAPADSQNACYFALTGPETIFPKEGITFRDIKDGMSNTLMLVEARRDIPWTKPEDIPYATDKPSPTLGGFNEGGFHAVFCDGSAQFLTDALQDTTFRGIATRAGQEVFEYRDK